MKRGDWWNFSVLKYLASIGKFRKVGVTDWIDKSKSTCISSDLGQPYIVKYVITWNVMILKGTMESQFFPIKMLLFEKKKKYILYQNFIHWHNYKKHSDKWGLPCIRWDVLFHLSILSFEFRANIKKKNK